MPNGYDPSAFPTSYNDPAYAQADAQAASAVGIPVSMLNNIRTKGEKSNADQISSANAATPYQITPATRQAILDQTGTDPYLNPQTAAYGAAYLLKQSLDRNSGNPVAAVAEYHGGTDQANWGPRTMAYVKRVTGSTPNSYQHGSTPNPFQVQPLPDIGSAPGAVGGQPAMQQPGSDPYAVQPLPNIGSGPGANSNAPSALTQAFQAYQSGKMAPQDAAQFEQDVSAGRIVLPSGMSVKEPAPQPAQPAIMQIVPQQVVDAFNSGQMQPADAAQFQKDIASNNIALPPGATLNPPQPGAGRTAGVAARGYLEGLGQGIGGVIDRAKGIIDAPMNAVNAIAQGQGPLNAIDSALGTNLAPQPTQPAPLAGAPNAAAQIPSMEQSAPAIANKIGLPVAQTPGEQVVQEGARGAGLMTQPFPGASLRALPAMVAAGTAGGAVGEQVHQQTGSQALGLAANLLTTALSPMAASRVMKALVAELGAKEAAAGAGAAERAEPTMQASAQETPAAQGAEPTAGVAQPAAQESAQAVATTEVAPATPKTEAATAAPSKEAAAQPESATASAKPAAEESVQSEATPAVPDDPDARREIISLMQKASGQDKTIQPADVETARQQLLERFKIDPQAVDAARELGMLDDLHPDHLATDIQMIKLNQLLKSDPSNPMAAQEAANLTRVGQRAIDTFNEMGAAPDISAISEKVNNQMRSSIAELKDRETNIYERELWRQVPKTTEAEAPAALQMVNQVATDLGGAQYLPKELKMVAARLTPEEQPVVVNGQRMDPRALGMEPPMRQPTLGLIDQTRRDVGEALSNNRGPFANADTFTLGKLYDALSHDQGQAFAAHGAADLWEEGKQTTILRKSIEGDMLSLFGRTAEKSMLPLMENAIRGLKGGNVEDFSRVVSAIPKSMRNEVLTSTLQKIFTKTSSAETGPFNWDALSAFGKGMKQDSSGWNALMGNLEPEARSNLSKLMTLAQRISFSTARQIKTGQSLFAKDLRADLNNVPQTFVDRARSTAGPAAGRVVGGAATYAAHHIPVVGPIVAPMMHGLGDFAAWAITPNKVPVEKALSDFILSDDAKAILEKGQQSTDQQMKAAAHSSSFRKFYDLARGAAANDPVSRENWLRGALNAGGQLSESNTNKRR